MPKIISKILHSEKRVKNDREYLCVIAEVEDDLGNKEEVTVWVGGEVEVFYHQGQVRGFVKKTAQPKVDNPLD